MPNARQYRDDLYKTRAHPNRHVPSAVSDDRDSFLKVYLSVIPFAAVEYLMEANSTSAISGLAFPTGWLIFWAFYYSFYRPGYLENKLNEKAKLSNFPVVVMGSAIWLVKATIMELGSLIFTGKKAPQAARPQPQQARPRPHNPGFYRQGQTFRPGFQTQGPARQTPPPQRPTVPPLPSEVMTALAALGLRDTRNWDEIHRRYRELAKKFHPDLNPEITSIGNRFMAVDAAYRKLNGVKDKYFQAKRSG